MKQMSCHHSGDLNRFGDGRSPRCWRTLAGPQQRHGKRSPRPTASALAQRLLGNITGRLWNELTESARDGGAGSLPPINLHSQKNKDGGGQRQHHPPGGADRSWTHLSTGACRSAGIMGTREEHTCLLLLTTGRLGGSWGSCAHSPLLAPATHSAGLCQGPAKHLKHPRRETVTP